MLKIYCCILFSFFFIIVPAQNSYSVLKKTVENEIKFSQHHDALDIINSRRDDFSAAQQTELDVLKMQSLNELGLVDEAFALSQHVLSQPSLSLELKMRTHLQRALIYEIGMNRVSCKRELDLAEKIIEKNPTLKPANYTYFLVRKGSYQRKFGDHKLARKIAEEAEKYAFKVNDKKNGAVLNMFLAYASYAEPVKALHYFQRGLSLCKFHKNASGTASIYNNISRFYIDKKNLPLAEKYIDSAIALAPRSQIFHVTASTFRIKSQIAELNKNYDEALKNYKIATEWTQKETDAQRDTKVRELDLMYDFETDKLKQQKLANSVKSTKQWNSLLLVSILLLVFLAVVLLYSMRLISQQKQSISEKNEVLKKNVDEKEFLVRELNHRVKNNLAVILSLVSFQRDVTPDELYKYKFEQLYARINAIALAHRLLSYNINNFDNTSFDIQQYIDTIIDTHKASYPHELIVESNIETFQMPVDQGLSFGLLINELLTNSLKHAVPFAGEVLTISINVALKGKRVEVEYRDNGQVFGRKERSKSLGRFIIDAMVQQLGGECKRDKSTYRGFFQLQD